MPQFENDAILVDTRTAALVSDDGSVDWLCPPPADAASAFTALLGNEEGGRWEIAPFGQVLTMRRGYRGETLVLETELATVEGSLRIVDFMPQPSEAGNVVRLVGGVRGEVRLKMELRLRVGCGRLRPWLRTPVETRTGEATVLAEFLGSTGELVPFVLSWHLSHERSPDPIDPFRALADTEAFWIDWVSSCARADEWGNVCARLSSPAVLPV
jgi:GH15 family glucan-1,4-alpha-glucosidase